MVDYSKWKNIQLSDDDNDDDDDKARYMSRYLNRGGRQSKKEEMERKEFNERKSFIKDKMQHHKVLIGEAERQLKKLNEEYEQLEIELEGIIKRENEMLKNIKKKEPINTGAVAKAGFVNKTSINNKTDEDMWKEVEQFVRKYNKELIHFAMLGCGNELKAFLKAHPHLISIKTTKFLSFWCIKLIAEKSYDTLNCLGGQQILINRMLELASTFNCEPVDVIDAVFIEKIKENDDFQECLKVLKNKLVRDAIELQKLFKEGLFLRSPINVIVAFIEHGRHITVITRNVFHPFEPTSNDDYFF